MKLEILLLLIVASAICVVSSEPSKRSSSGGSGNPLGIIKAELVEEDATAVGGDMEMASSNIKDQLDSASSQRIVIKPIRKHRGKRIRIRLVNAKKPKNIVRLKVSGTKNVEQKYPGNDDEDNNNGEGGNPDYDSVNDEELGNETINGPYGGGDESEDDSANSYAGSEDAHNQNGEDSTKKKHFHHHYHHIKTVVKKEPYEVEKIVHVPVEKIVHVPKPYPVHVEKIVEKLVHVPKPYPVEKIVHVPKIIEKIVYKDLYGKDSKYQGASSSNTHSYSGPKSFADLTHDSKLKFGAASGSSLDIIYPSGGGQSSFPSNSGNNGLFNSYGQPLGKHPKFPEFEDINKHQSKFNSNLDNDAFDFGGMHTSKPKDHHNGKKNKKSSNKNRNGNKNKHGGNHKNQHKSTFGSSFGSGSTSFGGNTFGGSSSFGSFGSSYNNNNDDYSPSSSANSHSYSGISMPSYTHEFSVSNSDQKEVYFNPSSQSSSGPNHQHVHTHQTHYESEPFRYPSSAVHDGDSEYVGHASTQNSEYNWSPSVTDFGSSSSAFNLPTQYSQNSHFTGAESSQAPVGPIGPVFRPPRKNPPAPFHGGGKKGSHGAPRAGPRRPRNNQGESFRGSAPSSKMAGHHHHHNRPEGGLRASASNNKGLVHHSRPRPQMATSATEQQLETVMLPPATTAGVKKN